MPLPAPLLRRNPNQNKYDFGHVLVIAGSPSMLGAAALTALAAMRSGAGLVTVAVPKGLNLTLQKKITHVVMTMPLAQTAQGVFSMKGYDQLKKVWDQFDAVAIGPGLGRDISTQEFARQVVGHCPKPLVVDADGLNALAEDTAILRKAKGPRVLTPHPGEMARFIGKSAAFIDTHRKQMAVDFACAYRCVLLLKGHRTIVASPRGKAYVNRTGNVGMATAGSGDVLTGMIVAFLGQGLDFFQAACFGAYYHGKAGDKAVKIKSKISLIASDLIDHIPSVL